MSERIAMCDLCDEVHDLLSSCDPIDRIFKLEGDLLKSKDLIHHAADENERLKGDLIDTNEVSDENYSKAVLAIARIAELEAELAKYKWVSVEGWSGPPTDYWGCNANIWPMWMGIIKTWSKAEGFYLEDGTQVEITHIKPISLPAPTIKPATKNPVSGLPLKLYKVSGGTRCTSPEPAEYLLDQIQEDNNG